MACFVSVIMNNIKLISGVELLGRLLLAALFFSDGWTVINNHNVTAQCLSQFSVPPLLLVPALLLQVDSGLLVAVGWNTLLAVFTLSFFCASTAVIFHNQMGDPTDQIQFWKDLAVADGFLILVAHGAGIFSLDSHLSKPKV
jgi:putative oxidoreductase